MTKRKIDNIWADKVMFTNLGPRELLRLLAKRGFNKVIITGGHLSASFMKERLVDQIWIDLMPRAFTNGIRLFEGGHFDVDLKLLKVKRFAGSEVQLRYKVIKYH